MSVMNVSLGALSSPLLQPQMGWEDKAPITPHIEESTVSMISNIILFLK